MSPEQIAHRAIKEEFPDIKENVQCINDVFLDLKDEIEGIKGKGNIYLHNRNTDDFRIHVSKFNLAPCNIQFEQIGLSESLELYSHSAQYKFSSWNVILDHSVGISGDMDSVYKANEAKHIYNSIQDFSYTLCQELQMREWISKKIIYLDKKHTYHYGPLLPLTDYCPNAFKEEFNILFGNKHRINKLTFDLRFVSNQNHFV